MTDVRLKTVEITGLFGMFNHVIELRTEENITILHGQNGVGKTTILKMIDDLFNRNLISLFSYSFESFSVSLSNGKAVKIARSEKQEQPALHFSLYDPNKTPRKGNPKPIIIQKHDLNNRRHYPMSMIEAFVPFLDRVAPDKWINRNTGELMQLNDVLIRFRDELPLAFYDEGIEEKSKQIFEFLNPIQTHFIQTQRLFVEEAESNRYKDKTSKSTKTTIEEYSNEMSILIKEAIREAGTLSSSLDRTFPNKILSTPIPTDVTEETVREKYNEQMEYRKRLMLAGLIDDEAESDFLRKEKLDSHDLKVLWHYLSDVDKKFNLYNQLLKKIELFVSIIDSRFQYKKINVNKDGGFTFKSNAGKPIPLKSLSSGEQHELVLAFRLIFKVEPQSLILIDEPELSLHVTWQQKFLDDIKEISNLSKLDFLIATHSPSIVHGKRRLMSEIPTDIIEVYNA